MYSGDLGWVTEDGWVTITGRVKDIINRGGEKFSALEIEQAIVSHAAVSAAAVVGVPDRRLGEAVAAFVTLKDGSAYPGDAAMSAHLDALGLARQKTPIYWTVLRELPLTATGKVQKRELVGSFVSRKF
jgi:acyl-CoA synthetase